MRIEVLSRRSGVTPKAWNAHLDHRQGPRSHIPLPRFRALLRGLIGSENAQAARYIVEHAWGLRMAAMAARRLPPTKCDFVLSFGGFCHIAALKYAGTSNIPIIANWNDPFPSLIAPQPYGEGPNGPLPQCYRRLLTRIGRAAAWHVFPSERLRGYMLKFLPKPPKPAPLSFRTWLVKCRQDGPLPTVERSRSLTRERPASAPRGRVLRRLGDVSCPTRSGPRLTCRFHRLGGRRIAGPRRSAAGSTERANSCPKWSTSDAPGICPIPTLCWS